MNLNKSDLLHITEMER